jgi:ABC-type proline/glycine betaine transport system permease subunit
VAVLLTAVEGIGFLVLSAWLAPSLRVERPTIGLSSLLFFLIWGLFLLVCAGQLLRRHSWARAPIVAAQLIQVFVAASFWGGRTSAVTVVGIAVAVAVLVGVLHPRSLAALDTGA